MLAVLGLSSFAIKSSLAPVLSATRNMAVLLRAMPARKKIRKFTDPLDHRREKSDGSSMVVHAQSIQSFDIEHSDSSREEREKEAELAKSKIVEIFKVCRAALLVCRSVLLDHDQLPASGCRGCQHQYQLDNFGQIADLSDR